MKRYAVFILGTPALFLTIWLWKKHRKGPYTRLAGRRGRNW